MVMMMMKIMMIMMMMPAMMRLVGRLVGRSVGWLVGRSVGRLAGWSVGRLVGGCGRVGGLEGEVRRLLEPLVLLLEVLEDLVHHVVDVRPSLARCDRVDKGDLRKPILGCGHR